MIYGRKHPKCIQINIHKEDIETKTTETAISTEPSTDIDSIDTIIPEFTTLRSILVATQDRLLKKQKLIQENRGLMMLSDRMILEDSIVYNQTCIAKYQAKLIYLTEKITNMIRCKQSILVLISDDDNVNSDKIKHSIVQLEQLIRP